MPFSKLRSGILRSSGMTPAKQPELRFGGSESNKDDQTDFSYRNNAMNENILGHILSI